MFQRMICERGGEIQDVPHAYEEKEDGEKKDAYHPHDPISLPHHSDSVRRRMKRRMMGMQQQWKTERFTHDTN